MREAIRRLASANKPLAGDHSRMPLSDQSPSLPSQEKEVTHVQDRPLGIPPRARKLRQPLTLVLGLVAVVVMSSIGWADSCSTISLSLNGGPVTCTLPEQTPELALVATLTGLSFSAQALGNGNFLNAKICSDVGEGPSCSGASDSISLSENATSVPEPGTFLLLASGLFSSGALKLYNRSFRQQSLKPLRS